MSYLTDRFNKHLLALNMKETFGKFSVERCNKCDSILSQGKCLICQPKQMNMYDFMERR